MASQRDSSAAGLGHEFWDRYFKFYDALNQSIPYRNMIARHVELLAPAPGEVVLDAGAGTGNVSVALAARGAGIVGIDYSRPALEICRKKVPQGRFLMGDLSEPLDFESGSFDKIACCCVLHLLSESSQRLAMAEFARLLRPGGALAVTAFAVGFSGWRVYLASVREQHRRSSLPATLRFIIEQFWNAVRVLYYLRRIGQVQNQGGHHYINERSLEALCREAGLTPANTERALASQCVTCLAVKGDPVTH